MKTDDQTLIEALRILVNDIQSDDGVANACIAEGANRLAELKARIAKLEEVLRWYGNINNYVFSGDSQTLVQSDKGQRAREALKDEQ
jgi:hypothetical protein